MIKNNNLKFNDIDIFYSYDQHHNIEKILKSFNFELQHDDIKQSEYRYLTMKKQKIISVKNYVHNSQSKLREFEQCKIQLICINSVSDVQNCVNNFDISVSSNFYDGDYIYVKDVNGIYNSIFTINPVLLTDDKKSMEFTSTIRQSRIWKYMNRGWKWTYDQDTFEKIMNCDKFLSNPQREIFIIIYNQNYVSIFPNWLTLLFINIYFLKGYVRKPISLFYSKLNIYIFFALFKSLPISFLHFSHLYFFDFPISFISPHFEHVFVVMFSFIFIYFTPFIAHLCFNLSLNTYNFNVYPNLLFIFDKFLFLDISLVLKFPKDIVL